MTHPIDIFYCGQEGAQGWAPIEHMAKLAARVMGGKLHMIREQQLTKPRKLWLSVRPPMKGDAPPALYIARTPIELANFMQDPDFKTGRTCRMAWIIDSFWTEWCPSKALLKHYDFIAHMQHGEADFYDARAPGRTLFAGWGADVLELGAQAMAQSRDIDVLRVGRQPAAWDDDQDSANICAHQGLNFHGRPPYAADPDKAYQDLLSYYGRSKYIIAHSNLVDQTTYTHGKKDYMTGRWTDALACGAMVAGKPPYIDSSVNALLWPKALLPFEHVALEPNTKDLAQAIGNWTPDQALQTHLNALKHLDWRWRFYDLAQRMGYRSDALDAEISKLSARIDKLEKVAAT